MKYKDIKNGEIVISLDNSSKTIDITYKISNDEFSKDWIYISNGKIFRGRKPYDTIYSKSMILDYEYYYIEDFKKSDIYLKYKEHVDKLIQHFFNNEDNKVFIRKYKLKLLNNLK